MSAALALLLGLAADEPLAREAFAVLRKHCAACHGDGPRPRAGLSILDREQLVDLRHVVVPGRPKASEVVWLMDSGAMPPGARPRPTAAERAAVRRWVEAGAPPEAVPPAGGGRGEEYILSARAADWAALPAGKRRSARYVSLNHLDGPARDAARAALERALSSRPAALDEPASVFRLDLAALGWDRRPLSVGGKPSTLDLFDLILLEYPYGVLTFGSPGMERVVPLLREMNAVRPVPYVRGDWLAAVVADRRFGPELLGGAKALPPAPPAAVWPEFVRMERVAMELGWRGDAGRLKRALDDVGLEELPLGKPVFRRAWEARYPRLVRKLEIGTPIVPLDGVTVPDVPGDGSLKLSLRAGQTRYFRGDVLRPFARANQEALVRLLHLDPRGKTDVVSGRSEVAGGAERPVGEGRTLGAAAVIGDNVIVALAVPKDAGGLPPGDLYEAPGRRGRYVLRVYRLKADGSGFEGPDAGRVVKATAVYEYRGAKR